MKLFRLDQYSLPVQMVLSQVAMVILTAVAIGLPSIWLIRWQLDRQAWALVDQGGNTTRAFFATRQSDLTNLAILTAQRPSLVSLLERSDAQELEEYLNTLQTGAGLDFVLVCDAEGQVVAQAGQEVPAGMCQVSSSSMVITSPAQEAPRAWLRAAQPISTNTTNTNRLRVIVGQALDSEFAIQLRNQTGLEQTLQIGSQPVATSFRNPSNAWQAITEARQLGMDPGSANLRSSFLLDGVPYHSIRFTIDESGLESIVSLHANEILQVQRQLTGILAAGILGVTILGLAVAAIQARRISRPLARLKEAAIELRNGNLTTPLAIWTRVPEVVLVANAMEDARVALQHTILELSQEKDWVEHLLESIVEGIVTLDSYGRITYFSRGAEKISGWRREQAVRRPINEIFRPAEGDELFINLLPSAGGRRKINVKLRDGRLATLAITGGRLAPPEAGRARVVLVLRDISEEDALNRLLGDFLANISHEFRTPLAALDASIELLLDQLPDLSQAELQELLNSIHLGVTSLQTLIDNLLEATSIETGHFQVYPRRSDLSEIVNEAVAVMRPLLEKYGQTLQVSGELARTPAQLPPVQADPRRTVQVLVNLLSNAIKHSPQGAEIDIKVQPDLQALRVTVSDMGPGIPPEHQPGLFRRFAHFRSGNERAEYGAGLGLSVVKAIVEAQGGQVGVRDRARGGAAFWFTLPLSIEKEPTLEDGVRRMENHGNT
jgi:PAS domain S-box-containing protein